MPRAPVRRSQFLVLMDGRIMSSNQSRRVFDAQFAMRSYVRRDASACVLKPAVAWLALLACSVVAAPSHADGTKRVQPDIDSRLTQQVTIDGTPFEVPQGCEWTRVAADPLIRWPIVATWDAEGHLIVAESVWNRESVQQQLVSRPHRIVRLIDRDRDGNFDERQVVAEDLSFPEGVLCIGRDLYVSAPPQIWKLTDTDADGVCDAREVWFDGQTLTHCANDLHGPWLGPDGWIYWSKSAFAEQNHLIRSGRDWKSSASHLYRRHPSGGPIEPVMTGGMDNLVDVAWLPNGDRFFCATFLHHPRHGFRDGIGQATYGAVYGKPHGVLAGHPRTGALMPATVELGPAAPAGLLAIARIDPALADRWKMEEGTAGYLLSAQFNLQKIGLHPLATSRESAGYQAGSIDLVQSSRIDFHPVDVLLDRDGSLVVLDTGGWYDLCCPSSGTDQRVALGGIYRLRGVTDQIADTRDPRVHGMLHDIRPPALAQAMPSADAAPRVKRVWDTAAALAASQNPSDREAILSLARDPDVEVRIAALNAISLHAWPEARGLLLETLEQPDARCARLAAEGLGRIGIDSEVPVLMKRFASARDDRWLQHGLLFAMIEGARSEALEPWLGGTDETAARAAALVLWQSNRLRTEHASGVLRLATSQNPESVSLALEILEQHPEWNAAAEAWLQSLSASGEPTQRSGLAQLIARWAGQTSVQQLVQNHLEQLGSANRSQREWVLEVLRAMAGQTIPETWSRPLARWIEVLPDAEAATWSTTLASLTVPNAHQSIAPAILDRVQRVSTGGVADRLSWIAALPAATPVDPQIESEVMRASADADPHVRSAAIAAMRKIQWRNPTSWTQLQRQLSLYSPLELSSVLEAVMKTSPPEWDAPLLENLVTLDATKALNVETVVSLLKGREASVQPMWREALLKTQSPPEELSKEVERWLAELPQGDRSQGYHVFRSSRAGCSACHQVGYVGGNVGPVLSQIGRSRGRRELLEAILFPSARLEQGYRSVKVRTTDGEVLIGLVREDTPDRLVMQVAADRQAVVQRSEIEAQEPSTTSIMPAGLERQLSRQELADLLAFLENAK